MKIIELGRKSASYLDDPESVFNIVWTNTVATHTSSMHVIDKIPSFKFFVNEENSQPNIIIFKIFRLFGVGSEIN